MYVIGGALRLLAFLLLQKIVLGSGSTSVGVSCTIFDQEQTCSQKHSEVTGPKCLVKAGTKFVDKGAAVVGNKCVGCRVNDDCASDEFCDTKNDHNCKPRMASCTSCTSACATPKCVTSSSSDANSCCVGCTVNAHCDGKGKSCNLTKLACEDKPEGFCGGKETKCAPMAAGQRDPRNCPVGTPVCDSFSCCVQCTADSHCNSLKGESCKGNKCVIIACASLLSSQFDTGSAKENAVGCSDYDKSYVPCYDGGALKYKCSKSPTEKLCQSNAECPKDKPYCDVIVDSKLQKLETALSSHAKEKAIVTAWKDMSKSDKMHECVKVKCGAIGTELDNKKKCNETCLGKCISDGKKLEIAANKYCCVECEEDADCGDPKMFVCDKVLFQCKYRASLACHTVGDPPLQQTCLKYPFTGLDVTFGVDKEHMCPTSRPFCLNSIDGGSCCVECIYHSDCGAKAKAQATASGGLEERKDYDDFPLSKCDNFRCVVAECASGKSCKASSDCNPGHTCHHDASGSCCVECVKNFDCRDRSKPMCAPESHTCVPFRCNPRAKKGCKLGDKRGREACTLTGTTHCLDTGGETCCVGCLDDFDCKGETKCDLGTHTCVAKTEKPFYCPSHRIPADGKCGETKDLATKCSGFDKCTNDCCEHSKCDPSGYRASLNGECVFKCPVGAIPLTGAGGSNLQPSKDGSTKTFCVPGDDGRDATHCHDPFPFCVDPYGTNSGGKAAGEVGLADTFCCVQCLRDEHCNTALNRARFCHRESFTCRYRCTGTTFEDKAKCETETKGKCTEPVATSVQAIVAAYVPDTQTDSTAEKKDADKVCAVECTKNSECKDAANDATKSMCDPRDHKCKRVIGTPTASCGTTCTGTTTKCLDPLAKDAKVDLASTTCVGCLHNNDCKEAGKTCDNDCDDSKQCTFECGATCPVGATQDDKCPTGDPPGQCDNGKGVCWGSTSKCCVQCTEDKHCDPMKTAGCDKDDFKCRFSCDRAETEKLAAKPTAECTPNTDLKDETNCKTKSHLYCLTPTLDGKRVSKDHCCVACLHDSHCQTAFVKDSVCDPSSFTCKFKPQDEARKTCKTDTDCDSEPVNKKCLEDTKSMGESRYCVECKADPDCNGRGADLKCRTEDYKCKFKCPSSQEPDKTANKPTKCSKPEFRHHLKVEGADATGDAKDECCVACLNDSHCDAGQKCRLLDFTCHAAFPCEAKSLHVKHRCSPTNQNSPCGADKKCLDTPDGACCVECNKHADCKQTGKTHCNKTSHTCVKQNATLEVLTDRSESKALVLKLTVAPCPMETCPAADGKHGIKNDVKVTIGGKTATIDPNSFQFTDVPESSTAIFKLKGLETCKEYKDIIVTEYTLLKANGLTYETAITGASIKSSNSGATLAFTPTKRAIFSDVKYTSMTVELPMKKNDTDYPSTGFYQVRALPLCKENSTEVLGALTDLSSVESVPQTELTDLRANCLYRVSYHICCPSAKSDKSCSSAPVADQKTRHFTTQISSPSTAPNSYTVKLGVSDLVTELGDDWKLQFKLRIAEPKDTHSTMDPYEILTLVVGKEDLPVTYIGRTSTVGKVVIVSTLYIDSVAQKPSDAMTIDLSENEGGLSPEDVFTAVITSVRATTTTVYITIQTVTPAGKEGYTIDAYRVTYTPTEESPTGRARRSAEGDTGTPGGCKYMEEMLPAKARAGDHVTLKSTVNFSPSCFYRVLAAPVIDGVAATALQMSSPFTFKTQPATYIGTVELGNDVAPPIQPKRVALKVRASKMSSSESDRPLDRIEISYWPLEDPSAYRQVVVSSVRMEAAMYTVNEVIDDLQPCTTYMFQAVPVVKCPPTEGGGDPQEILQPEDCLQLAHQQAITTAAGDVDRAEWTHEVGPYSLVVSIRANPNAGSYFEGEAVPMNHAPHYASCPVLNPAPDCMGPMGAVSQCVIRDLVPNCPYQARVRSYCQKSGTYSSWKSVSQGEGRRTEAQKVKATLLSIQPGALGLNVSFTRPLACNEDLDVFVRVRTRFLESNGDEVAGTSTHLSKWYPMSCDHHRVIYSSDQFGNDKIGKTMIAQVEGYVGLLHVDANGGDLSFSTMRTQTASDPLIQEVPCRYCDTSPNGVPCNSGCGDLACVNGKCRGCVKDEDCADKSKSRCANGRCINCLPGGDHCLHIMGAPVCLDIQDTDVANLAGVVAAGPQCMPCSEANKCPSSSGMQLVCDQGFRCVECTFGKACELTSIITGLADGYTCDADKGRCVDIRNCIPNNEQCLRDSTHCDENYTPCRFGKCIDAHGSFYCACRHGYRNEGHEGLGRQKCVDLDECADRSVCGKNSRCLNTPGSYSCSCLPGFWSHRADGKDCRDADECQHTAICGANSVCTNTEGSFSCTCLDGFASPDNRNCMDVDECAHPAPAWCKKGVNGDECCPKNSECRNVMGSFVCHCWAGYRTLWAPTGIWNATMCLDCEKSINCFDRPGKPICDTSKFECEECMQRRDCAGNPYGHLHCNQTISKCVECFLQKHCADMPRGMHHCNPEKGVCAQCLEDAHCGDHSRSRCFNDECVVCETDQNCAHFPGVEHAVCRANFGCTECARNNNCTDPYKSRCDLDGICRRCVSDVDCSHVVQFPACDGETDKRCVECVEDWHCSGADAYCFNKHCLRPKSISYDKSGVAYLAPPAPTGSATHGEPCDHFEMGQQIDVKKACVKGYVCNDDKRCVPAPCVEDTDCVEGLVCFFAEGAGNATEGYIGTCINSASALAATLLLVVAAAAALLF